MAAAVDKAYQTIREGIVSGAFPPGSHLTAQGLAAASGLSRTPVREAMRRLHVEGLVTFIPHRGAFVARMEERDIQKIYDLRAVLESFAAEAAATEANASQLTELEQLAEQMAAAVRAHKRDMVEEVARLNNLFHRLIVTAAGNPRLEFALASIVEVPLVLRTFRRYTLMEMRRSTDQHLELVAAFRTRDAAWARSIMTSHIHSARNALIRSLAAPEA
jgi:DNA-binding GntR family transcriptional regulator